MSDQSFLPHFITEEIYLIKEELPEPESKTQVVPPTPETPSVENAPQAHNQAETLETETPQVQETLLKEPEPVYLKPLPTAGNNLKHCLVLVESEDEILEADLKGLLEKIMGAVKRGMEDILLVNVKSANEEQIEALLNEQNHRHLLAFGTSKVAELSEAGTYELTQVNRKHYLKAHSLTEISQQIELKKALWGALKEMF